jgi:hypothetical protein
MMKGFFFEASDAQSYAEMIAPVEGKAQTVVAAEAPTDLVNSTPPHSAAGEGSGVYILNEDLSSVTLRPPQ